jgi:hypothetical protein
VSFSNDLKKFRLKIEKGDDELIQGVEIALFSAVIMDTPVLSGRLRGNWQASFDTPAEGTPDDIDKPGSATINKMSTKVQSQPGGRLTYLANNLPYAVPIEYGLSTGKAPEGMVRKNVVRFQNIVDREAKKRRI